MKAHVSFLRNFLFSVIALITAVRAKETYGPYTVEWTEFEICRSFRTMNSLQLDVKTVYEDKTLKLWINATMPENVHLDMIKMRVLSNDKPKKLLWSYNIENPCKHFALEALLNKIINSKDCIITKGNHFAVVSGWDNAMEKMFGASFFYGSFHLRTSLHEKKRNLLCVTGLLSVKKKD